MSIGNGPTVGGRATDAVRDDARRGVPAWAPGRTAAASSTVADELRRLAPDGWTALHDLHGAGDATRVEHVVVGPGGVVVVAVAAAADDVADAATDAAWAAGTVTALLAPRHRSAVRAVVCVTNGTDGTDGPDGTADPTGDAVTTDPTTDRATPRGPAVVAPENLGAHLRALPTRLRAADVSGLAQHLGLHLDGPRDPGVLAPTRRTGGRRRVMRPSTPEDASWPWATDAPPLDDVLPARGATHASAPPLPLDAPVPPAEPLGRVALALRGVVVVSTAWVTWVFTAIPLGLI